MSDIENISDLLTTGETLLRVSLAFIAGGVLTFLDFKMNGDWSFLLLMLFVIVVSFILILERALAKIYNEWRK